MEQINLVERMLNPEVLRDALAQREGLHEAVATYQRLSKSIRAMAIQAMPEGGTGSLDGYTITVKRRESRQVAFEVKETMQVRIQGLKG